MVVNSFLEKNALETALISTQLKISGHIFKMLSHHPEFTSFLVDKLRHEHANGP
jgi:hypothetical protein